MTSLRVASLYPLCTAVQGDGGNARVLAHRAGLRGIECVVTTVHDGPVPPADVLLVAGVDDGGMPHLCRRLAAGGLAARVAEGAVVLAVNAGYQVLGHRFVTPDGGQHDGLHLLDVTSGRAGALLAGPVITRPNPHLDLPALSAYESHFGTTTLGPQARPFVELEAGSGNDGTVDGAVQGRILGTYLNGPLLARNHDLADLLLEWALGAPLAPAPSATADALRTQRIAEDRADPSGWGGRSYGRARPRGRLLALGKGARR